MKSKKTCLSAIVRLVSIVVPVVFLALPASGQHSVDRDTLLTGAQWDAFNKSIVKAVHSDNAGIVEGALTQIAYYGDYLEFPELTVFEVMHIYRDNDDHQVRRLAIVALGNMGSNWAIEFLDMLAPYEESDALRSTMEGVVREAREEG
jgi:hypothetical protein